MQFTLSTPAVLAALAHLGTASPLPGTESSKPLSSTSKSDCLSYQEIHEQANSKYEVAFSHDIQPRSSGQSSTYVDAITSVPTSSSLHPAIASCPATLYGSKSFDENYIHVVGTYTAIAKRANPTPPADPTGSTTLLKIAAHTSSAGDLEARGHQHAVPFSGDSIEFDTAPRPVIYEVGVSPSLLPRATKIRGGNRPSLPKYALGLGHGPVVIHSRGWVETVSTPSSSPVSGSGIASKNVVPHSFEAPFPTSPQPTETPKISVFSTRSILIHSPEQTTTKAPQAATATPVGLAFPDFAAHFGAGPMAMDNSEFPHTTLKMKTRTRPVAFKGFPTGFGHGPVVPGKGYEGASFTPISASRREDASRTATDGVVKETAITALDKPERRLFDHLDVGNERPVLRHGDGEIVMRGEKVID